MNLQAVTTTKPHILIVDDEQSIRHSLAGVFLDEGFHVSEAADGESALESIKSDRPDVVILDIWMPGLDGLQTLSRLKALDAELPVIMISGHATIATAVKATQMGASDFIEKPLDLEATLLAVNRALEQSTTGATDQVEAAEGEPLTISESVKSKLTPVVFTKKALLGDKAIQKTLAKSAILYGLGLHSGRKSGLVLEPLGPDSGIHFVGVSERTVIPAHVNFVESTGWATTLKLGETQIATIEHLLSALHAYGISNLLIKCNGEVPVLDGSAKDYCTLFEETGLIEQEGDWREIAIREPIRVTKGKEYIEIVPSNDFTIEYILQYPEPIGRQEMTFTLDNPQQYKTQIAPARTFGFVKDISYLQKQGLALGGRFDNFVLLGEQGPINTEFRFPNEPVRHKILDAIGDLYLLGRRIRGKVTACMTGHSDNIALARAIVAKMDEELAA